MNTKRRKTRHDDNKDSTLSKKQKTCPIVWEPWLPIELWALIFQHLCDGTNFGYLLTLRQTCHLFRTVMDHHIIKQDKQLQRKVFRHLSLHSLSLYAWQYWHQLLGWKCPPSADTLSRVIENMNIPLCQWMGTTFTIPRTTMTKRCVSYALMTCVTRNRISVLNCMHDMKLLPMDEKHRQDFTNQTFWQAAERGNWEMCTWLLNKLQASIDCISFNNWTTIRRCLEHRHGVILALLERLFHLSRDYRKDMLTLFQNIMTNKFNRTDYRYMQQMFHFTLQEIRCPVDQQTYLQCTLFQLVVLSGQLTKAKWMRTTFQLTEADAREHDNYILKNAARNGNLKACVWLYNTFQLTPDDVATFANGCTLFFHFLKRIQRFVIL